MRFCLFSEHVSKSSDQNWGNGRCYRLYSPTAMINAYLSVHNDGNTIRGAANKFGLPEAILRRRVNGKVGLEVTKSGSQPTLSLDEEAHLVNHIYYMAACGYGYSRTEIIDLPTVYAISLNKRDCDHPLSSPTLCSVGQS